MGDRRGFIESAEKLADSPLIKLYDSLYKLFAFGGFLVACALGIWRFFTVPVPESSTLIRTLNAIGYTLMVCSSTGVGITVAYLGRLIIVRKRGMKLVDAIIGVPTGLAIMYYLLHSNVDKGIIVQFVIYGFGPFLIFVVYPFLHLHGFINLYGPPPWVGAGARMKTRVRNYLGKLKDGMNIWGQFNQREEESSKNNPSRKSSR